MDVILKGENRQPRVFIGLPVYNGAKYLSTAIESILSQTYVDFQLLISDNKSTDSTARICADYQARDRRVHYIQQPKNLGAFGNFTYLKDAATGDFFSWMGADDVRQPTFLEETVELLDSHSEVMGCASNVESIGPDGEFLGIRSLAPIYHTIPWQEAKLAYFRWPPTQAYLGIYGLFRRDFIQNIPLPAPLTSRKLSSGVDLLFMTELACRGRLVALDRELMRLRSHDAAVNRSERSRDSLVQRIEFKLAFNVRMLRLILTQGGEAREKLQLTRVFLSHNIPRPGRSRSRSD